MTGPRRIVCLTEETVETLYLLGQEHRIAGVTGYAVRPPRVRREKPRVGAFETADLHGILSLEPDLVLLFSDVQAPLAAELMRAGIAVHGFNQRSVAGILDMIRTPRRPLRRDPRGRGPDRPPRGLGSAPGRPTAPASTSRSGTTPSSPASAGCPS